MRDGISIQSQRTIRPSERGKSIGTIDKYELVEKLGGGAFGAVYKAHDTYAGVDVAIKTLHPLLKNDKEEVERIKENFRRISQLSHPHIAGARDLSPISNVNIRNEEIRREMRLSPRDPVLVMAFAPGVTLSRWKSQFTNGVVPATDTIEIVAQVADALDYAHSIGIMHRDVKPANIMIETHLGLNNKYSVQVLDFGLAADIRNSMSRISTIEEGNKGGTRPYMAPEQWSGKLMDGRSDQYALACVAYELLSGLPPFAGVFETGDIGIMSDCVLTKKPDSLKNIPVSANHVLQRALEKEKDQRFETCSAFVEALKFALDGVASRPATSGKIRPLSATAGETVVVQTAPTLRSMPTTRPVVRTRGTTAVRAASTVKGAKTTVRKAPTVRPQPKETPIVVQSAMKPMRLEVKKVALGGSEMVDLLKLPTGNFVMGSPVTEVGRAANEEQHEVAVNKVLWMSRTPITQGQWKALMGTTVMEMAASKIADESTHAFGKKSARTLRQYFGYAPDKKVTSICGDIDPMAPMYWISWNDARQFCRKLTAVEREARRIPAGYEYRLPTEAEWEYACRAGTKTALPNGKEFSQQGRNSASCLDDIAWYAGNSWKGMIGRGFQVGDWAEMPAGVPFTARAFARAVRLLAPNLWGFYDMIGNVYEWCEDWYGTYPTEKTTAQTVACRGQQRVLRGGSWDNSAHHCRSAYRRSANAAFASYYIGFRIVLAPIL